MDELIQREELVQELWSMADYFKCMIQADKESQDGTLAIVTPHTVKTIETAIETIRRL